jgi:hypothetical protein
MADEYLGSIMFRKQLSWLQISVGEGTGVVEARVEVGGDVVGALVVVVVGVVAELEVVVVVAELEVVALVAELGVVAVVVQLVLVTVPPMTVVVV